MDRVRLLQTCKSLRAELISEVYSSICIGSTDLPYLICSIHRKPDLGALIRHIKCSGSWIFACIRDITSHPGYAREVSQWALSHVPIPAPESWGSGERWRSALTQGSCDVWLTMLLPFLLNTRSLEIDNIHCNSVYLALCEIAIHRNTLGDLGMALQCPEECVITSYPSTFIISTEIFPLMRLPKMRILRLSGIKDDDTDVSSESTFVAGTSTVEEIYFPSRCSSQRGFYTFITACAILRVYEYQHSVHVDPSLRDLFRARPLYEALLQQKRCLEIIRINDKADGQPWYLHPDYMDFGSLSDFPRLRELRLPFCCLVGPDRAENGSSNKYLASILPMGPCLSFHYGIASSLL